MRALITILIFLSFHAKSQTLPSYRISGIVADSVSRKPLDYVTINLKISKDQPAVNASLTKSDGSFTFQNLKPGKYLISIASVGYKPKLIPTDLTGDKPQSDLQTIFLNPSSAELKEVVVMADRPLLKQEVDRLTYDLQADPESKVNSVLDMMKKVPLLSLDAEENIRLKGNDNFKILINGKPSSMMERNAKDILRSMPASSIEKIEVITTPPAKYDAEGLAGIINIITNKKIANGYNGSVNLSERFPVGGPGIGGSYTLKAGKFGLSVNGGASIHNSPLTESSNSRRTFGDAPTSLQQIGGLEQDSRSGYFNSEISYELDSLNLISTQLNINGNDFNGIRSQLSVLNGDNSVLQGYDLTDDKNGQGTGLDLALNYQLGFKADKNRLLTVSYRFFEYANNQYNDLAVINPVNYNPSDYQQDNKGSSAEQTFQVDYVHPIKKLNIEAGVKGIFRTNNSDFEYRSLSETDGFITDPTRSNKFNNTQNVIGIYNTYQYNLSKWGFKAGVRVEQTVINADFISAASIVEQNYFNVIPSVSVNRKFKDKSSLNFGYTTRMNRPGIYRLNPFVDRSNPNFETAGNPNIRPTTGTMLQLGYSRLKKVSVNTGLGFMFINDLVMPISTFDHTTNITRTTFGNTGKARLMSLNFNVNHPINPRFNYSLNGQLNYGWIEGTVSGSLVRNKGLMPNLSASGSYRLEKGWRLNSSANLQGRNLNLQGGSNSFVSSSFSFSKNMLGEKLTFSAAVNNPFTKYRTAINHTTGLDFMQESYSETYLRSFNTSLNYRFGALKDNIKKNKRGIKNDDISQGNGGL
ncbi:TonB-dependent receptor [Flavihumibacter sp. R14]|nr:TonB-dependent receptor [Flavihumibacter soli]